MRIIEKTNKDQQCGIELSGGKEGSWLWFNQCYQMNSFILVISPHNSLKKGMTTRKEKKGSLQKFADGGDKHIMDWVMVPTSV